MQENLIQIRNLSKSFETQTGNLQVLNNISFDVKKGETLGIVGPNGIGKTTILNIISGILEPDSGTISIYDNLSGKSRISYIMQNSTESLFPWKSAWDNISFSLELKNLDEKKRRNEAEKLVRDLNLDRVLKNLDQYPYQMSGGMKQACSIARAVMHEPLILLMDEPFASLDFETRMNLEDMLLDVLQKKHGITSILVSHDIDEAVYMSSRIVVLSRKASIVETIDIDLDRPRNQAMLKGEKFFLLKNRVFEAFRKGVDAN